MRIRILLLLASGLLSACASTTFTLNDLNSSLGFISVYEASVEDYKQGRMMEARTRILTIERDDDDYRKARNFLKNKVNPARLKLLRYYTRKGKREEENTHWASAAEAYQTATALSIKPKALIRYHAKMLLQVRQFREQTIYEQLKKEHNTWLQWLDAYNPPLGLKGTDFAFEHARASLNATLEHRLKNLWLLANNYKQQGFPEMAWVYADAYLRLMPDSEEASQLRYAMAKKTNRGFILGGFAKNKVIKENEPPKKHSEKKISKDQVMQLMAEEKWLSARIYAYILRRQGHPDADHLLEKIGQKNASLAALAFKKGNLAFRLEHIDKAVEFWDNAAKRMPKEQAYRDSLRRGKQIQERLHALKAEESQAEKEATIEE